MTRGAAPAHLDSGLWTTTGGPRRQRARRTAAVGAATAGHRPPVRRAGRRHAGLVPRRRADHLSGSPPTVERDGPRSGPVAVRRLAGLRGAALRLRPAARAQPHGRRAAGRARRSGGSACTCSAASPEIERPADTPGREAGHRRGRTAGLAAASRASAFLVGEAARPGHGRAPAGRGADAEQPAGGRCSTCCRGSRWTAAGSLSAAVWRATGRRHTGTVVAGWARPGRRRARPRRRAVPRGAAAGPGPDRWST